MTRIQFKRWACIGLLTLLATSPSAFAHGTSQGDLRVNHGYAMRSATAAPEVWVYFRSIRNDGDKTDHLLNANTPVATGVELQRTLQQGASKTGLPVAAIKLPARASTPMDHSKGGYRLLLKGLTQPLKDGDRFDLQLQFERAGSVTIKVWMQACQACKN